MSLSNDLTKHQVFLQRLAGMQTKVIKAELDLLVQRAFKAVEKGTYGPVLKQQLRSSVKTLTNVAVKNMTDFAVYESEFTAKTVGRAYKAPLTTVSAEKLENKLRTQKMDVNKIASSKKNSRKSLAAAYDQFGRKKADEVTQIIRDGQVRKIGKALIRAAIVERVAGLFTAQSQSLAKTSVLYTTNVARAETLKQNRAVVGSRVIFVLGDSVEHTDICLELEGNVYDVGDAPSPPLHWGCNSYIEPYTDED